MPTDEEVRLWKEVHIPQYMEALRVAYRAVYDDPYRLSGVGNFKRYLNMFDKMLSAMGDAVDMVLMKRCHDSGLAGGKFDSECRPIHFFHEVYHFIQTIRYYNKTHEDDRKAMPVLEKYLVQAHIFLDRGEFDHFSVYSGDCGGGHHWWNFVYSEEDHVYTVADEDLEEYCTAYNIMAKWTDEFGRVAIENGHDRICRMLRNVVKRMEVECP